MSEWLRKLDAYSRRALAAMPENAGFDVTLRMADADADDAELKTSGLELHARIGGIVVGRVPDRAALERVASLESVAEVQSARPLYNEPEA